MNPLAVAQTAASRQGHAKRNKQAIMEAAIRDMYAAKASPTLKAAAPPRNYVGEFIQNQVAALNPITKSVFAGPVAQAVMSVVSGTDPLRQEREAHFAQRTAASPSGQFQQAFDRRSADFIAPVMAGFAGAFGGPSAGDKTEGKIREIVGGGLNPVNFVPGIGSIPNVVAAVDQERQPSEMLENAIYALMDLVPFFGVAAKAARAPRLARAAQAAEGAAAVQSQASRATQSVVDQVARDAADLAAREQAVAERYMANQRAVAPVGGSAARSVPTERLSLEQMRQASAVPAPSASRQVVQPAYPLGAPPSDIAALQKQVMQNPAPRSATSRVLPIKVMQGSTDNMAQVGDAPPPVVAARAAARQYSEPAGPPRPMPEPAVQPERQAAPMLPTETPEVRAARIAAQRTTPQAEQYTEPIGPRPAPAAPTDDTTLPDTGYYLFVDRGGKKAPLAGPFESDEALESEYLLWTRRWRDGDPRGEFDNFARARISDPNEQKRAIAAIKKLHSKAGWDKPTPMVTEVTDAQVSSKGPVAKKKKIAAKRVMGTGAPTQKPVDAPVSAPEPKPTPMAPAAPTSPNPVAITNVAPTPAQVAPANVAPETQKVIGRGDAWRDPSRKRQIGYEVELDENGKVVTDPVYVGGIAVFRDFTHVAVMPDGSEVRVGTDPKTRRMAESRGGKIELRYTGNYAYNDPDLGAEFGGENRGDIIERLAKKYSEKAARREEFAKKPDPASWKKVRQLKGYTAHARALTDLEYEGSLQTKYGSVRVYSEKSTGRMLSLSGDGKDGTLRVVPDDVLASDYYEPSGTSAPTPEPIGPTNVVPEAAAVKSKPRTRKQPKPKQDEPGTLQSPFRGQEPTTDTPSAPPILNAPPRRSWSMNVEPPSSVVDNPVFPEVAVRELLRRWKVPSIFHAGGKNTKAAGIYDLATGTTRNANNDAIVAMHEWAHAVDDRLKITGKIMADEKAYSQLIDPVYAGTIRPGMTPATASVERLAEFVAQYAQSPKAVMAQSPDLVAAFRRAAPKAMADLENTSEQLRQWRFAPMEGRVRASRSMSGKSLVKTGPSKDWRDKVRDISLAMWHDVEAPAKIHLKQMAEVTGANKAVAEKAADTVASLNHIHAFSAKWILEGPLNWKTKQPTGTPGLMDALKIIHRAPGDFDENMLKAVGMMDTERILERFDIKMAEGMSPDDAAEAVRHLHPAFDGEPRAIDAIPKLQQSLMRTRSDPNIAAYDEFAKWYRQASRETVQALVDSGRISQDVADSIFAKNRKYVNWGRVIGQNTSEAADEPWANRVLFDDEAEEAGGGGNNTSNPIKRLRGSYRMLGNPVKQLVQAQARILNEAAINEVRASLFEPAMARVDGMDPGDVMLNSRVKAFMGNVFSFVDGPVKGNRNVFSYYVGGKQKHALVHDRELADSIREMRKQSSWVTSNPLTATSRMSGRMITYMLQFVARNTLRDTSQRTAMVGGLNPIDALLGTETYKMMFTKTGRRELDDIGAKIIAHGGGFGPQAIEGVAGNYEKMVDQAIKMVKGGRGGAAARVSSGYQKLVETAELANRAVIFKKTKAEALKAGASAIEAERQAAVAARDFMDFPKGGRVVNVMNAYIPFLRAAFLGPATDLRLFRKNPAAVTFRSMMIGSMGAALEYKLAEMGGNLEELEEMPSWRRDFGWNFKIGPDMWGWIPKPFGVAVIYSGISRAMSVGSKAMSGYEPDALARIMVEEAGELVGSAAQSVPSADNLSIGPIGAGAESLFNKQLYRQSPIVPQHEVGTDVTLRDTSRASSLARALAGDVGSLRGTQDNTALKIDPRYIDNTMRRLFGYVGSTATTLSDIGREDRPPAYAQLSKLTGLSYSGAGSAAQVVETANRGLRRYSIQHKPLQELSKAWSASRSPQERDEMGRVLREYARIIQDLVDQVERQGGTADVRKQALKDALEAL